MAAGDWLYGSGIAPQFACRHSLPIRFGVQRTPLGAYAQWAACLVGNCPAIPPSVCPDAPNSRTRHLRIWLFQLPLHMGCRPESPTHTYLSFLLRVPPTRLPSAWTTFRSGHLYHPPVPESRLRATKLSRAFGRPRRRILLGSLPHLPAVRQGCLLRLV